MLKNKKTIDEERIFKAAASSLKENRKLKAGLMSVGAGLAGLMLFTGAPVFAEEVDTIAVTSTTQSEAVVMNVSDDEMDNAETNGTSAALNETTDAVENTSTETENIVDHGTDNIGDESNAENNSVVESEETVDATEDSSTEINSNSKENVIVNAVMSGAENGDILAAVTTDEVQKETGMTEEQIIAIYNKYFPGETWEDTWDDESESVLYDNFFNNVASDAYEEKTGNGVTYKTISSENEVFREEALRMINFLRELAGLNPVTLNDEYNTYCQAGVEYLAENNLNISHIAAAEINEYGIVTGAKAGYEDAHEGLMGSNLSQGTTGYITVNELILNFFSDDDISNRTSPGHRYWILDPTLTEIGIGYCYTSQKQYLAVYIEGDRDTSSLSDSYNNSWPASGAFPYELLEETANYDQTPWSIMLGEDYQNTSNYTIGEDFKITITDDEGHTYVIDDLYDASSDSNKKTSLTGDWYTYATLYGSPHALKITFNPGSMYADYLYQIGEDGEYIGYEALKGHKFTVTINGLYIGGQEDVITYDVDFVSMFDMVEKANERSEGSERSEDFQDVYDLIDALPSTITLSNKTAVEEARRAYDALEDKTDFDSTKLNKLTSAETEIVRLEKDVNDTSKANDVISVISALPEKSSVTLDNESAVIAARTAYDGLTDDQKAKVTNLSKLTDAEEAIVDLKDKAEKINAVYDLIDSLPSTITLSDKTSVENARKAYDALEDKSAFDSTKLYKLTSAETEITRLEKDVNDASKANDVISVIGALPEKASVTLDNESAVIAARTAYNGLTDDQKAKVTNLTKLTDAEAAIASLKDNAEKVNAVYDLIDALPSTITLSDKTAVKEARTAYDALEDKTDFDSTKLYKLTSAETEITRLEKDAEDTSKANDVITLITALPEKTDVTLDNESAIIAARTAYDGLTDDQKAKVTDLTKLTDAETRIVEIKNESAADQDAVNHVIALINVLPSEPTLNDKEAVDNAYAGYNVLTDMQKGLLNGDTVNRLMSAKRTVDVLEVEYMDNINAAQDVIDAAANLPAELTLDDESGVVALRTAYDALNDTAKAMVDEGTVSKLINAENAISALKIQQKKQQDADAVEDLIDNIPETLTLEDKNVIETARTAYDALEDKSLVDGDKLAKLVDAEAEIKRLESYDEVQTEADRVIQLIDALPDPADITLEDAELLLSVRNAYTDLTDAAKDKVTNINKLFDGEVHYAALYAQKAVEEKQIEERVADIKATYAAEEAIWNIPAELTYSDYGTVKAAKEAYLNLTEQQKALVKAESVEYLKDAISRMNAIVLDVKEANAVAREISELSEDTDSEKLCTVRQAYDALNDVQKQYVNIRFVHRLNDLIQKVNEKLIAGGSGSNFIEKVPETEQDETPEVTREEKEHDDRERAQNIVDLVAVAIKDINSLTLADRFKVESINATYQSLSDEAKAMIPDSVKTQLESAITKMYELKEQKIREQAEADIKGKGTKTIITEASVDEQFVTADIIEDSGNPSTGISNEESTGLITSFLAAMGTIGAGFFMKKRNNGGK